MKFSYTKFPIISSITGEDEIIYRPIIPMDIGYHSLWLSDIFEGEVEALLDSGADRNVAPMELAELLEVDMASAIPEQTKGVEGGLVTVYYAPISLRVGEHIFESIMGFGETIPLVLLGGKGFFDGWKVTFDYPEEFVIRAKPSRLH